MSLAGIRNYLCRPHGWFFFLASRGFYDNMPDEEYLRRVYRYTMNCKPDFVHPKNFNEKLNWMKLHDHNPLYTTMVDKYEVKQFVSDRIGAGHVIPLLGGPWNSAEEIDFDTLPEQFVLKCTHDSGSIEICRDRNSFDAEAVTRRLSKKLKQNYFLKNREWAYKNVAPRIIAEPFIPSLGNPDSLEYKLTCFNGKVKIITVCRGIAHSSFDERTNDNYDRDGNHLPWYAFYKNASVEPGLPPQIDQIISFAEKLTDGIPQVRCDFYMIDNQVYFGEFTFYTWSGLVEFTPPEWNDIMGSWIHLPCDEEHA